MDEKRFVKLLWIAKAALLAVLLYVGVGVVTNRLHLGAVFDPGTASGDQRPADEHTTLPQTRSPSDYTAIVQRNLFTGDENAGKAGTDADRLQTVDSLASGEELGLQLVGTLAGSTAASRAIIQDTKSNATASYKVGDTVASATVETIERDAVILRHQGQPLVLKRQAGRADDKGPKTQDKRPTTEESAVARPASPVAPSSYAESSRAGYVTEVFRRATIEPYIRNNQTEGLKITGLENIPMATVFGLKDGDIVQTVNGQQLTSKQKAFQVLMKAKTQSRIDIQLLRDGKTKNLSFDL